ncbi:oxidoreductase [Acrasis kona]|uniref:Oxidoreductase n=1 Tax=Acrasis kona TaxID=1008807 RepID=A0AAW2Z5K6_9EUKA
MGNRGTVYSKYIKENPNQAELVAIVEPRDLVRQRVAKEYSIKPEFVFNDWRRTIEHIKKSRIDADAVVICVQDRFHLECATAFAEQKYHMLLEKPLAPTLEECEQIVEAAERNKVMLCVCHVMRYSYITQLTKELVNSGVIGEVINLQHLEPVGNFHYAHSYVRGNWRRKDESSFMLLTKSCHDVDWICYVMGDKDLSCNKISSFGSLKHLRRENAPKDSTDRCVTCPAHVENNCAYSAKKIYLEPLVKSGHTAWPVNVIVSDGSLPDIENVTKALEEGPYGRCAYKCDNDVVDNQVVNLEFSDGSTCSFTMIAYTKEICERRSLIFGSKGQLEILQGEHKIKYFDFVTRTSREIDCIEQWNNVMEKPLETELKGHGYADWFLMNKFVKAVAENDPSQLLSDAKESLKTHKLVFQAEESRLKGQVINCV